MIPLGLGLSAVLAGFVQGAAGFGFGMVLMSLAPWLIGVRTAVPLVACTGLLASVSMLAMLWRQARWTEVAPLLLAGALTSPLGVLVLRRVPARGLWLVLATGLLAHVVSSRGDRPPPSGGHRGWALAAGAAGGLLGGAVNTAGPPVVAYAARYWSAERMRANLQLFFAPLSVLQLGLYARAGMLDGAVLWGLAAVVPGLVVGVTLGHRIGSRLAPARFARMVWTLLLVMGLAFGVRGLMGG